MWQNEVVLKTLDCHEIAPGLFVGSAPQFGGAVARAGFDVLVFCANEHQPPGEAHPGVVIARARLEDDGSPMSKGHMHQALATAGFVAARVREGKKVLVTCFQGRNRSGLVAALALTALTGASGACCARAVRARRQAPHGPALTNRSFLRLLDAIGEKRSPGIVTRQAARAAGI